MPLPKIDVVIHEIELPILKKKVRYRPFLVKEQKILLMAATEESSNAIEKAIRQIINNCCIDDIDIENLSIFDVEYFFMHIRAVSVGEIIENNYRCKNVVNDQICNNLMNVSMNLREITISGLDTYNDIIRITDNISVKMTLPRYSLIEKAAKKDEGEGSVSDFVFDLLVDCIEHIYEGEQIYYAREIPRQELVEFLESLNTAQFDKIQEYFNNIPKLNKTKEVTCSKCGHHHKIEFEGIESFFA